MNSINWNASYTEKAPTFSIAFYGISPIKKHNDAGFVDKTYYKRRYLDNNFNKE